MNKKPVTIANHRKDIILSNCSLLPGITTQAEKLKQDKEHDQCCKVVSWATDSKLEINMRRSLMRKLSGATPVAGGRRGLRENLSSDAIVITTSVGCTGISGAGMAFQPFPNLGYGAQALMIQYYSVFDQIRKILGFVGNKVE